MSHLINQVLANVTVDAVKAAASSCATVEASTKPQAYTWGGSAC